MMKKLIERLINKYGFRHHYSSLRILTETNVRQIIKIACEAQRKACVRMAHKAESFEELINTIESAQIMEVDYE